MILLYRFLYEIQEFTRLCCRAVANLFRKPSYLQDSLLQMEFIGTGSVVIIMITGFFIGGVLALQSAKSLRDFGAANLTGQLVTLALVRELGPLLTALMVAGRVGSGITSELGSMVVTEQINAMRALGTDPSKKLVTPRMLACTTMLPLLTIVADFSGLVGGAGSYPFTRCDWTQIFTGVLHFGPWATMTSLKGSSNLLYLDLSLE